ncbi:magnesium chelatase subunit ChlD-like protein [Pseudomonas benzenivorans]|nr:VWA domain-containing protein [Pseudomonas benzenivorans]SDH37150.1 magnesium chelatase subunit ChlD-like protein [Pseudomonas benzenivorans]
MGTAPSPRIHWPRTLLNKRAAPLLMEHLHFHRQAAEDGLLHCLLLDCSGSMLKRSNLALAKGLLLRWSEQIYRQRGELAVIGFAGNQARLLQRPQKAVPHNEAWIAAIGGGGGSPLAGGLQLAERTLAKVRKSAPGKQIGLWLLSDGRFSQLPARPRHADFCVVVDFENQPLPLGRAVQLARLWGAEHVRAVDLCGAQ